MSIRPKTLLIIMLILLSLALVACERERPPATVAPTTAPRGTVAPSPTPPAAAATQVTLPAAAGIQPTAAPATAVTPTAPPPQPVVVNPGGQSSDSSGGAATHTVQAGDTLAAIAARYNVTQDAIIQLNNLTDPNVLTVGQALKIPAAATAGSGTTTTTAEGATIYVVQSGDTLAAIARRFGTTSAELAQLNGLTDPNRIVVGQRLTVPATGGATAPATGDATGQGKTHIVASGETLLKIAQRYGVTVKAIQNANGITNPDLIKVGQVLKIP